MKYARFILLLFGLLLIPLVWCGVLVVALGFLHTLLLGVILALVLMALLIVGHYVSHRTKNKTYRWLITLPAYALIFWLYLYSFEAWIEQLFLGLACIETILFFVLITPKLEEWLPLPQEPYPYEIQTSSHPSQ